MEPNKEYERLIEKIDKLQSELTQDKQNTALFSELEQVQAELKKLIKELEILKKK